MQQQMTVNLTKLAHSQFFLHEQCTLTTLTIAESLLNNLEVNSAKPLLLYSIHMPGNPLILQNTYLGSPRLSTAYARSP